MAAVSSQRLQKRQSAKDKAKLVNTVAVTIRELSKKCGLSISTVSKALNGYSDISKATRAMVGQIAKEMGYFPNTHARALKTKRTYNLGVLFVDDTQSGLTHSYFSTVLEAFKSEAERSGYDITFISHNFGSNHMTYLEHCSSREVDGVCIACVDFLGPEIAALVNSDLQVITIDHLFSNRSCIQSNNLDGMRQLVEYVYEMGHRKVAYVHGTKSAVTDVRLGSFSRTADELGLRVPECYLQDCIYNNPSSVYQATHRLLEMPDRPTCILVSDDYAALGALEAAADMGLKVPEDVSIAGYDGIGMMQLMRPRLTTIQQDSIRIGTEAAKRLVELIENPKTTLPEIAVIPCTLLEGETIKDLRGKAAPNNSMPKAAPDARTTAW